MRRLFIGALLVLAGCGAAEPIEENTPRGDARLLSGEWHLELRPSGLQGFSSKRAKATLLLDPRPSRDSLGHRVPSPGELTGTFELHEPGAVRLPERPIAGQGDAGAMVFGDGRVVAVLQTTGNCSDCGNVTLDGQLKGDEWRGIWYQETLGDLPGGKFILRRAELPAP